jgi:hypothetical protein
MVAVTSFADGAVTVWAKMIHDSPAGNVMGDIVVGVVQVVPVVV